MRKLAGTVSLGLVGLILSTSLWGDGPEDALSVLPGSDCPAEFLDTLATSSADREFQLMDEIRSTAIAEMKEITQILQNHDVRLAEALASERIQEILERGRPDPLGSIQQLEQKMSTLTAQGRLGANTALLITRVGRRMRAAGSRTPRNRNGGILRPIRVAVEAIPFVGASVAKATDAGKPISFVLREIKDDVNACLAENKVTNENLQEAIQKMAAAKEGMRRYAIKLKFQGLWLLQQSKVKNLPDEESQYRRLLSVNTLEEAETCFDLAKTLADGRQRAYEISIGLANASRTLRTESTKGLTKLATTGINAKALDQTITTLENAVVMRKAGLEAENALAQAVLRAAQLAKSLSSQTARETRMAAQTKQMIEAAQGINRGIAEARGATVIANIESLEKELDELETSDERNRAETLEFFNLTGQVVEDFLNDSSTSPATEPASETPEEE